MSEETEEKEKGKYAKFIRRVWERGRWRSSRSRSGNSSIRSGRGSSSRTRSGGGGGGGRDCIGDSDSCSSDSRKRINHQSITPSFNMDTIVTDA